MSIKGSSYVRFRRAVARGNLDQIRHAAMELPHVPLDDALRVCLLMAQQDHRGFDRAAARWLARFTLEASNVGLEEIDQALSALTLMPEEPDRSAGTLIELGAAHGLRL